jgi:hypothetical protein
MWGITVAWYTCSLAGISCEIGCPFPERKIPVLSDYHQCHNSLAPFIAYVEKQTQTTNTMASPPPLIYFNSRPSEHKEAIKNAFDDIICSACREPARQFTAVLGCESCKRKAFFNVAYDSYKYERRQFTPAPFTAGDERTIWALVQNMRAHEDESS